MVASSVGDPHDASPVRRDARESGTLKPIHDVLLDFRCDAIFCRK